ncbi:putative Embryo sac development arrest 6 [Tripterygium wilfordii]|uniref:Putative Embryo sac development arrest 6 n=1 Tax=Tripterygium wilfordii TaxID=458696 RepID=A0A7J7E1E4_TRIWF|nr:uncharacterized protein LOC120014662 [Tripterygium wilfordii]KAF5752407.1 putative Embryo sac development arrest 6 [Tripterygium wilfordii]
MSHHARRMLPPGLSKKRRERESFSFPIKPSAAVPAPPAGSKAVVEPMCSNRLLAGYMAYEFLTKGTLFGKKFVVPPRREAVAVPVRIGGSAELKRVKREAELGGGKKEKEKEEERRYDEVASIMKSDGVHIPGIVNPTQLARWTQAS